MVGHTALGVSRQPISLPSLHGGEQSSLPKFVPPNDTVSSKSVEDVKLGNSSVVIGCQVHKFSCT